MNTRSVLQVQKQPQQCSQIQAKAPPTPTITRRVQNPDGTISIIRTTMAQPGTPGALTMVPTVVNNQSPQKKQVTRPGTKKVFLSKDGKIVGALLVHKPTQPNANSANNTGKIAISRVSGVQNPPATPTLTQTGPPANTIPSLQQQQTQQQQQHPVPQTSTTSALPHLPPQQLEVNSISFFFSSLF
jgi:hypothetical protein